MRKPQAKEALRGAAAAAGVNPTLNTDVVYFPDTWIGKGSDQRVVLS
jgi:hypothetical protein